MKSCLLLYIVTILVFCSCQVRQEKEIPIPYLKEKPGHATCIVVDGKPMLLIAGEPLNSTGSYPERLDNVLAEMSNAHYNTALVAVSWQLVEPIEGQFDFSYVDNLLKSAKKNNIKIGLLWFGAWKNGISPYAPSWVLKDTDRFKRVRTQEGQNTRTLSPFCENTLEADKKAFSTLMGYLAKNDKERTVIIAQVENEIGVLGQSRDYSSMANEAFCQEVPDKLIEYLVRHKKSLEVEVFEAWEKNGFKFRGSWVDVFGESSVTDMFFMAWYYARYVDCVAEHGKESYPIPMYVNCWMSQERPLPLKPGSFPSGGPVVSVIDIWKAGAPSIDFLSPDIYDDRIFHIHPKQFHRSDNPLLVPEMHMQEGRATLLFAEHDAMGASPFGFDGYAGNIANEYKFLNMMMPVILDYQGSGKMRGFMRISPEDEGVEFEFDEDVSVLIKFNKRTTTSSNEGMGEPNLPPAYGLFIKTSENEFMVGGLNLYVAAKSINQEKEVWLNNVREGYFDESGEWLQMGVRNGDEAGFLTFDDPHYSIGFFKGYHQEAVGSTVIPSVFKFEVIKYNKQ